MPLFYSFFKTLVGKEIVVELKNDIIMMGTLVSVDSYLNVKLGRCIDKRLTVYWWNLKRFGLLLNESTAVILIHYFTLFTYVMLYVYIYIHIQNVQCLCLCRQRKCQGDWACPAASGSELVLDKRIGDKVRFIIN